MNWDPIDGPLRGTARTPRSPAPGSPPGPGASGQDFPWIVLSCFHKAIEKDLDRVLELMGSMPHEEMDQHFIGNLLGRLKFLSSVCAYHAKAEEDVIFPAIAERGCPSIYEECGHGEVRAREWGPFFYMSRVLAEVQSLMRRRVSGDVLQARLKGLVEGLHDIRNEMVGHMKEEETALLLHQVQVLLLPLILAFYLEKNHWWQQS